MSVPVSSVLLLSPREKAVALTNTQHKRLSEVITSKKVLLDHSTGFNGIRKKQKALEEVAAEFNLSYPAECPRTVTQLKRAWEYIRKREREECFRSIREGAETLNDDLRVSLQNFSALCEKLGNQAELAANAFAQAMQTSTNVFVQTMHNVDCTMEQVRKYYSPASGRPSSL
ncbi:hypothetical protein E2C01_081092 [Portunus trituberculatus]|uniref:Regulatory protein zeste n=1 Tax=Portunus trituberculatus TaxID=210409 RepID=A0A5B7IVQ0_PORTR|nr:hypothetical protein [Portunus trituberculatus]